MLMPYMLERDKAGYYDLPAEVRGAFEFTLARCYYQLKNQFNIYFVSAFTNALGFYRDEVYEALDLMDGNGFTINYNGYDGSGVEVKFDYNRLRKAINIERDNNDGRPCS